LFIAHEAEVNRVARALSFQPGPVRQADLVTIVVIVVLFVLHMVADRVASDRSASAANGSTRSGGSNSGPDYRTPASSGDAAYDGAFFASRKGFA
jgi:hypothetical protein